MRGIRAACAAFCIFAGPAAGFELEKLETLDEQNLGSKVNARVMIDNLCPGVEEASICRNDFELALNTFALVERLLRMAAISHPGAQRDKFLARADRVYGRGILLYRVAIVENTSPVSDDLMDAAKELSQQDK